MLLFLKPINSMLNRQQFKFLIFSIYFSFVFHQNFNNLSAQRFSGGLLFGMTACQVDGDTYAGFNKIGIQGGMFVNTILYNNIGFQFELKYAGKGAQKVTSTDNILTYKMSLHYIDLPVMITYTIEEHIVIDLGLVSGYLFARHGEKDGYVYQDEDFEEFRKIDFAWLAGVNYKITKNFIINARYSYSLRPIRNVEVADTSYGLIGRTLGYTSGLYNNFLTFGIYYQFN